MMHDILINSSSGLHILKQYDNYSQDVENFLQHFLSFVDIEKDNRYHIDDNIENIIGLDADDVIKIVDKYAIQIGTQHIKIREISLLKSAIESTINHFIYGSSSSLINLSLILACNIIKNHPFTDCNKRAALLSVNLFLSVNNRQDLILSNSNVLACIVLCLANNLISFSYAEAVYHACIINNSNTKKL